MISIVIAVRNEIQYIEKCIKSLFNQDYKGEYEVIVVDGMSDDGTYELLKKLQKKYNFTLLRNPKINAAAGRNIGITQAQGDYIAFIDGDAVADRSWLTQIKIAFENSRASGVGGPDLLPGDGSKIAKIIGHVMRSPVATGGRLNPSTQHTLMKKSRYVEHVPTCNLCLKKEVFTKVGMFDENFIKGQDLELSYRIIKSGSKLFYSPNIKVIHYRKQYIADFSRQICKWAKAKVAIIKKHGVVNWAYLSPVLGVFFLLLALAIAMFLNALYYFGIFIILAVSGYFLLIVVESVRVSAKNHELSSFFYALVLFPLVHLSYTYGVFYALFRRKIW
jgi:GT2 family glycosyltransferase